MTVPSWLVKLDAWPDCPPRLLIMAFIAFIARRVWWIPHVGAGSPQPGRRRLVLGMSIILPSCPVRGGEQVVDHHLLVLDRYVAGHAHHGLRRLHHLGNRSTRVETPTQRSRPPPRMVRSGERQSHLAHHKVFMVFMVSPSERERERERERE